MSPQLAEPDSAASQRIFACERCSRRKQRCDKVLPVCGQCLESRSTCLRSERESSVVQLGDNEIARKGYVTALQERISSLEDQVRQRGQPFDENPVHAAESNSEQMPGGSSFPALQPENSNMDINSLSLSAMAEPRSRNGEFLKHLSMPRIISGMTETYGGNPERTTRVSSLWDGIAKYTRHPSQSHRLQIPRAEAFRALETYAKTVDFRFPRMAVEKVRSGMDAITASEGSIYREKLSKHPAHIFMAYMVIAIVPLVSDDYPMAQGSFVSINVLAKCMSVLDRVFGKEDGVDIIQCLHLLVVFSIHCSAAGSAWHLVGFAMNKCIALGYHREPAGPPTVATGSQEAEQQRWAFWGCYFLDRLICSALGRPLAIDDHYVTVKLPTDRLSAEDLSHIHAYRYAQMLSIITKDAENHTFEAHLSRILCWRASAPPVSDGIVREAHLHQTALYHILMLQMVVQEILSGFKFDEDRVAFGSSVDTSDPEIFQDPMGITEQFIRRERVRIERLKLLHICRAAAKSLNRHRMTGRQYLSVTTGYFAVSIALGTLYWEINNSQGSDSFEFDADEQNWTSGKLLDFACQKLDIVGRQFPRLLEYGSIIKVLRIRNDQCCSRNQQDEVSRQLDEVKTQAMQIGPDYLRQLTLAVILLSGHVYSSTII